MLGGPLGYLIRSTLQIHPFFRLFDMRLPLALPFNQFRWFRSSNCDLVTYDIHIIYIAPSTISY